MSNYVKSTNFTSKDSLASGNPLKIVKGSEIDTEFNNIATAVATKADSTGATMTNVTFTGTNVAPTPSYGDSTTKLATTAFVQAALAAMYPVGSIYSSTVSTNPATLFGFGTWVAYAAGRVLVGDGGGFTAGSTGGSADATLVAHTHTLTGTTGASGQHSHGFGYQSGSNSGWFGLGSWSGQGFPGSDTINWNGSGGGIGGSGNQTSGNLMTTGPINNSLGETHTHSVSGTTASSGNSATNANLQPYVVVYMWTRTA